MIVNVPADGNCGFHAVVDQLSLQGVNVDPKSLRSQAVSYLKCHPELVDDSFLIHNDYKNTNEYLSKQSEDGHWIDEMMLRAISSCIARDINIVHETGYTTILRQTDNNQNKPIYIGQIEESHYVSLHAVEKGNKYASNNDSNVPINFTDSYKTLDNENKIHQPFDISQPENNDIICENISIDSAENGDNESWPSVWSEKVWFDKKETNRFLFCRNGKLGCTSCRDFRNAQLLSGSGVSLATQWVNGEIEPSGKGRAEKLRSIRKKICEHKNSRAHNIAEKTTEESQKEHLPKVLIKMRSDEEELTCKAFRTAYYLA